MSEKMNITETRPRKLFDGAFKMIKGENTAQLIEQFTAEMTLVAEGLCEDKSKIHRRIDQLTGEEDQRIQKLESRINLLETSLDEERAAHDRDITDFRNRLAASEKKMIEIAKESNAKKRKGGWIRDLTWLVGIAAGAWIVVTILNLLKP